MDILISFMYEDYLVEQFQYHQKLQIVMKQIIQVFARAYPTQISFITYTFIQKDLFKYIFDVKTFSALVEICTFLMNNPQSTSTHYSYMSTIYQHMADNPMMEQFGLYQQEHISALAERMIDRAQTIA